MTRRKPQEIPVPVKTNNSYFIAGQTSLIKAANELTISLNRDSPKSFHHVYNQSGLGFAWSVSVLCVCVSV